MKIVILICIAVLIWIGTIAATISATRSKKHAEPVVVPHCLTEMPGHSGFWFLPCSDVDRYEQA